MDLTPSPRDRGDVISNPTRDHYPIYLPKKESLREQQGLTEAIEHAAGKESEAVVHFPRTPDVKSKNKKPDDQIGPRA